MRLCGRSDAEMCVVRGSGRIAIVVGVLLALFAVGASAASADGFASSSEATVSGSTATLNLAVSQGSSNLTFVGVPNQGGWTVTGTSTNNANGTCPAPTSTGGMCQFNPPVSTVTMTFTFSGTGPTSFIVLSDVYEDSSKPQNDTVPVEGPQATTTSVSASPNPAVAGTLVTVTATVAPTNPSSLVPTGPVRFYDNGSQFGSGSLSGNPATASIQVSNLPVGTESITASYGGDGNFNPSQSSPFSGVVNPGQSSKPCPPNPTLPAVVVVHEDGHGEWTGQITASGGTPPYTYQDAPTGYYVNGSGQVFVPTPDNGALVTVTDANGCSSTSGVIFKAGSAPPPPAQSGQSLTTNNGVANLRVPCDEAQACRFSLILFGKNPCPPNPTLPAVVGVHADGYGGWSGQITASGGTPPYTYEEGQSGAYVRADGYVDVPAFDIRSTVYVTDANGCSTESTVTFKKAAPGSRGTAVDIGDGAGLRENLRSVLSIAGAGIAKKRRPAKLGSLRATVPAGAYKVLKIRLSKATVKLLARRGHLRVYLSGVVLQGGGVTGFHIPVNLKAPLASAGSQSVFGRSGLAPSARC